MFNKFPSISAFHSVRKDVSGHVDRARYRGKIKLHGTNAGIRITNKQIFAQSRSRTITPGDDNMAFARWVADNEQKILDNVITPEDTTLTIFGEWCGKGIMSGVAISDIDKKVFVVFAVQYGDSDDDNALILTDPTEIEQLINVEAFDDVYVLPWATDVIEINFLDKDQMAEQLEIINELVDEVEQCDPWVKKVFNVEGVGEGLVFSPSEVNSRFTYSKLTFKAKGEKHKVTKQKNAVQLDPEVVESIDQFIELVVTPARLEQGVTEACKGEISNKMIGPFIGWVGKDVKKESTDELEAAGLEWKQVSKAVSQRAREWYMEKLKEM